MNPVLAVGQIVVSVFLIIAILMQARGIGLSSAFGGDSSVYRSRRGVERQLLRFTVALIILFVGFSVLGYLQTNTVGPPRCAGNTALDRGSLAGLSR